MIIRRITDTLRPVCPFFIIRKVSTLQRLKCTSSIGKSTFGIPKLVDVGGYFLYLNDCPSYTNFLG